MTPAVLPNMFFGVMGRRSYGPSEKRPDPSDPGVII